MIPTRLQAYALMERHDMPAHIRRHSVVVARIATGLARTILQLDVPTLDVDLVERGALLHDIGKARALVDGGNHALIGAKLVEDAGYPEIASIVREHVALEHFDVASPVTESTLVNYADKRVMHDRVVSLEGRFDDLVVRYAKKEKHLRRLREMCDVYRSYEEALFERLGRRSGDLEGLMALDLPLPSKASGVVEV